MMLNGYFTNRVQKIKEINSKNIKFAVKKSSMSAKAKLPVYFGMQLDLLCLL